MKKWIQIIDDLIEKIPSHIRDIIQKASVALFALIVLVAVSIAVLRGLSDAKPGGMQIAEDTQDLFYLERLREQNREKAKLLEDIPIDPSSFPSQQNKEESFVYFGLDRSQNLMGESEDFLNNSQTLRKKGESLGEPLLQDPENLILYAEPATKESETNVKEGDIWQDLQQEPTNEVPKQMPNKQNSLSSSAKEELPFLE